MTLSSAIARLFVATTFLATLFSVEGSESLSFELGAGDREEHSLGHLPEGAFEIMGEIDPALRPGGDLQVVMAIVLGWQDPDLPLNNRLTTATSVALEVREGNGLATWELWIDGVCDTTGHPDPAPPGYARQRVFQIPNQLSQRDGPYPVKIVGLPVADGTRLRIFVEHFDRPVTEITVSHSLGGGALSFGASRGGSENGSVTALAKLAARPLAEEAALADPSTWEIIRSAINLEHPAMAAVKAALASDRDEEARRLFIHHLRTRTQPGGPALETFEMHPDYQAIADHGVAGRYGTVAWFGNMSPEWTDADGQVHQWVNGDGTINWARENGHLNRHFHWLTYAYALRDTGKAEYTRRFAFEVRDWVTREPFYWPNCPQVGGVNLMDGTVFTKGYMNTSNIGRRCELVWWYAWEAFRAEEAFDDEALLTMLLGMLRQSRLLMNPTSFAAHDDGGAHTSMALLQNALMLPELEESETWKKTALDRWEKVLQVQFYPDGSHVSGSTGYNWASIHALRNLHELAKRTGWRLPPRFTETLALSLEHPIALSRPDQGQIDMNDGGWGMVDDHYRRFVEERFPDRQDFIWMATKGGEGKAPHFTSVQFPHAGHLVQRTGWGPKEKYLFMDAGPMGASHGKNDKLNLYLALGPHQLISSGGRGSYDANPFSAYTSSTYAYNTVLVDDLPQQRVHLKHTHTGHVPEERRWHLSEGFEFMEGSYRSGWYGHDRKVEGIHQREVVFVKGQSPPSSSYWVVFDTVETKDELPHEFIALFHSRRDAAEIDPESRVFTALDAAAGFRILPAKPDGLSLRNARGQMQPYVQGWHVVGRNRAPMDTPEYRWTASGRSTRAWILEATSAGSPWQIDRWSLEEHAGEISLRIHRRDGSSDRIRRFDAGDSSRFELRARNPTNAVVAETTILPQ